MSNVAGRTSCHAQAISPPPYQNLWHSVSYMLQQLLFAASHAAAAAAAAVMPEDSGGKLLMASFICFIMAVRVPCNSCVMDFPSWSLYWGS